jgi:hypothetical protein
MRQKSKKSDLRLQYFAEMVLFFVFSSALSQKTEEKKGRNNGTHQI